MMERAQRLDRRGYPIGHRAGNGGQRRREACVAGHSMADAYRVPNGRRCAECKRTHQRHRYATVDGDRVRARMRERYQTRRLARQAGVELVP